MKTTFTLTDRRGLMPRDRWAIDMLAEHQALTTDQFTALGYDRTPAGAGRRLRILARRGWLVRIDSAWFLGRFGAQMRRPVAGEPDLTRNQFFVDLATHVRTQAGTDLRAWRSVPAPYGEYLRDGKRIGFWYQPDPGGPPSRWLRRYGALAAKTGVGLVLVTTSDPGRERMLRERLHLGGLTVATSVVGLGHPAGPVWLTHTNRDRLALHELPEADQLDPGLRPHPIYDPHRPGDEAIADGTYSYVQP